MQEKTSQRLAVACSAGGFKSVFVHGVLSALETGGVWAEAYAAASSSVFPAAAATIRQADSIGLRYWRSSLATLHQPGKGMSEVVLNSIAESRSQLHNALFQPGTARLLIATSLVTTPEGAALTQGIGATRLGRRLLLQAARGDASWARENLAPYLFDTQAPDAEHRLTSENIEEVIYASTRMLHAWLKPAEIAGRPFVDASYTVACPALELAERGYSEIIAIANEPGTLYRDIFQSQPIPESWHDAHISIIRPDIDPAQLGADFTTMSEAGMVAAYQHGLQKGRAFLEKCNASS